MKPSLTRRPLLLLLAIVAALPAQSLTSSRQRLLIGVTPLAKGLTFYAPFVSSLVPSRSTGAGAATYTRASNATYLDSSATIQTVTSGNARFDYATSGQTKAGYLVEPAATNLCLQSEHHENAAWTALLGTVAADTIAAPDGNTTADTFTATSANATLAQVIVAASSARTYSVWLKRKTGTGTVSVSGDGVTYTTAAVTSTWTRFPDTRTAVNPAVTVKIATSGDEVYVWGDQLEAGSIPTSYLATTSATVARSADVLNYTNTGNAAAKQGTMSCWVRVGTYGDGTIRAAVDLGSTSNTGLIFWVDDGTGHPGYQYGTGAGNASGTSGSALTTGVWHNLTGTWGPAGGTFYQDGALVASGTTAPSITLSANFYVGMQGNGGSLRWANGDIRDLRIYSRVLSASEAVSLYNRGL